MKIRLTLVVTLTILGNVVKAQTKISTDRPTQTISPFSIPKGLWQIESGLIYGGLNTPDYVRKDFYGFNGFMPSFLVRVGVAKRVELRFGNWEHSSFGAVPQLSAIGLNDLSFGSKVEILANPRLNTRISWVGQLIVPAGEDYTNVARIGFENRLAVAHNFGKATLGYNVGVLLRDDSKFLYSVVFTMPVSDKLNLFIEPSGTWFTGDVSFTQIMNSGITYKLNSSSQLDLSLGLRLNDFGINNVGMGYSILLFRE